MIRPALTVRNDHLLSEFTRITGSNNPFDFVVWVSQQARACGAADSVDGEQLTRHLAAQPSCQARA